MRRGSMELTDRDIKIFELIKKLGWVRQDNIAYFLGLDYEDLKVNHLIRNIGYRLQKHGYIIKKRFIAGLPNYWCFSKFGADLNDAINEPKFVLQNAKHDDMVARLLIEYLKQNPQNIVTEFELKYQVISNQDKKIKIPDLVLNDTTAIEVEISLKNTSRIATIMRQYKFSDYKEVIYYTTDKIASVMTNNNSLDSKFKFKIINEDDIINSKEFMNHKTHNEIMSNNIITSQFNEKQQLRARLGL
jgi:hypothetical protein